MSLEKAADACRELAASVTILLKPKLKENVMLSSVICACGDATHHLNLALCKSGEARSEELLLSVQCLKKADVLLDIAYKSGITDDKLNNKKIKKLVSSIMRIVDKDKGDEKSSFKKKLLCETARLSVSSFLKRDIDRLVLLCTDNDYRMAEGPHFSSRKEAEEFISNDGIEGLIYEIRHKSGGHFVGAVGIFPDGASGRRVKLFVSIMPRHRECGYACEVIDGVRKHFEREENKVLAAYIPEHLSYLQKTFLRCGFEKEGKLSCYMRSGKGVYVMVYNKNVLH